MTANWYEIWVSEALDDRWGQWFDGMEIVSAGGKYPEAGTILKGWMPDQEALFGVLRQIRNLNLTLVEVKRVSDH
ncbi:MAG TPA: hypothetical protein VHO48_13135 [Anaerolineaceae bacterium]|jgi:hypothetical protein|nr:hypothetical protein [Anaerolineaceae bacterium]